MAFINVGRGLGKNGNPGRPNAKNPYIILFKADDLKTKPVKDADGVSVSVNIELKDGKEAIVMYPGLGFNKLLGWPGNSLQMSHEYKDDEKEDTNMVKFESILPGDKYLHYTGLFPIVQGGTKGLGFEDFSVPHLVTESREFILTESGETIIF